MSTSPAAPPDERIIVLLRHGIAEDPSDDKADEHRGLTTEGHARTKQIARGLEQLLPKAQAIFTSPLLRAVQTALWVSKAYRSRVTVTTADVFAPGVKAKSVAEFLRGVTEKRIIVVGHEPSLSDAMRALTGLRGSELSLKKGGCYGVRMIGDAGALEWVLTPRVLRKLGE
ncbi:MAG TPA: histidine phosphatase family protein [Thermoanaerobaculia bacterium]|jgi:phosphohistidine phosphatase SixA